MIPIKRRFTCVLIQYLIFGNILLNNSCGFITEPDPFKNNDAKPIAQENSNANILNYPEDKTVTGVISPNFLPLEDAAKINKVSLFVDSTFIQSVEEAPFIFTLNTKIFLDGKHELRFDEYLNGDNLGMMQLPFAPPAKSYKTSLIFNSAPPTVPENININYENGYKRISWSTVPDPNFYCYDIVNYYKDIYGQTKEYHLKVYSQTQNSILDTIQIDALPFSANCKVGTSNNSEIKYSQNISKSFGNSLGLGTASVALDQLDDVILFYNNEQLIPVSTITGSIINKTLAGSNNAILKYDRSNIYTKTNSKFNIYDSRTFLPLTSFYYSSMVSDNYAVGRHGIIYSNSGSHLQIFDSTAIRLIKDYPSMISNQAQKLIISPDGNKLITKDEEGIKVFAVDSNSAVLINSNKLDYILDHLRIDWENSKIYSNSSTSLVIWDMNTLQPISNIQPPKVPKYSSMSPYPEINELTDIKIDDDFVYALYAVTADGLLYQTMLMRYRKGNMTENKYWLFNSQNVFNSSIGISSKGKYLFVIIANNQWIIDTRGEN